MLKVDTTVNAHSVAAAGDTKQHQFNPYTDNGGSCAAIAGKDYAILASDTRLSKGYSILSRETSKVAKMYVELLCCSFDYARTARIQL